MIYLKYLLFILTIASAYPSVAILWREGSHIPKAAVLILVLISLCTLIAGASGLFQIHNNKLLITGAICIILNICVLLYAAHLVSVSINSKISANKVEVALPIEILEGKSVDNLEQDHIYNVILPFNLNPLPHHAFHIEWVNVSDFPSLNLEKANGKIVFKVLEHNVERISENRWNDSYRLEIISYDEKGIN